MADTVSVRREFLAMASGLGFTGLLGGCAPTAASPAQAGSAAGAGAAAATGRALSTADIAANLDALRQRDPSSGELIFVAGHTGQQDGGEGWFYWRSGASGDNDGTHVASVFGGRWDRIWDRATVSVRWFGAHPSRSGAENRLAFQRAFGQVRRVAVPGGVYQLDSGITIPNYGELCGVGASYKSQSPGTLLHFTNTNGLAYAVSGEGTANLDRDMKIRDIAIQIDEPNATALRLSGARNCRVENVSLILAAWQVSAGNQRGLDLQAGPGGNMPGGCYYNVVHGLRVSGPGGTGNFDDGAIGLYLSQADSDSTQPNANVLRGISIESCEHGVVLDGTAGNYFYGLTVEGARRAVRFRDNARFNVIFGFWTAGISTGDTVPLTFDSGSGPGEDDPGANNNRVCGLHVGGTTDDNEDNGTDNEWGMPDVS